MRPPEFDTDINSLKKVLGTITPIERQVLFLLAKFEEAGAEIHRLRAELNTEIRFRGDVHDTVIKLYQEIQGKDQQIEQLIEEIKNAQEAQAQELPGSSSQDDRAGSNHLDSRA